MVHADKLQDINVQCTVDEYGTVVQLMRFKVSAVHPSHAAQHQLTAFIATASHGMCPSPAAAATASLFGPGARVALLVNNLGATPPLETSIVAGQAVAAAERQGVSGSKAAGLKRSAVAALSVCATCFFLFAVPIHIHLQTVAAF
jgi:hypothetical protein